MGTDTVSATPTGTVVPFRTAPPGSAVGTRIGLVASTGSDPFSMAVTESVAAQLETAGAELITCDPGADTTLMLDCARRLATQQVDGWIVVQPGDLGDALCDAGPVDVPLIAIAAPMSCQSAEVGADNRRAGFLVGSELGRIASLRPSCGKDSLVIVTNSATSIASEERTDGIRSGIETECPGLLPTELVLNVGPADRAHEEFAAVLNALPEDTAILLAAVDDGVALSAVAAIPETRSLRTTIAAIGADQRARCEIVANPRWIGDAALLPDRYGDVAVPALLDALRGREIPPRMFVETAFVTADSLGELYDLSDCPDQ